MNEFKIKKLTTLIILNIFITFNLSNTNHSEVKSSIVISEVHFKKPNELPGTVNKLNYYDEYGLFDIIKFSNQNKGMFLELFLIKFLETAGIQDKYLEKFKIERMEISAPIEYDPNKRSLKTKELLSICITSDDKDFLFYAVYLDATKINIIFLGRSEKCNHNSELWPKAFNDKIIYDKTGNEIKTRVDKLRNAFKGFASIIESQTLKHNVVAFFDISPKKYNLLKQKDYIYSIYPSFHENVTLKKMIFFVIAYLDSKFKHGGSPNYFTRFIYNNLIGQMSMPAYNALFPELYICKSFFPMTKRKLIKRK